MTIRSALVASLIDSSGLTKGLDNFSTITSDELVLWRKQSTLDDPHHGSPNVGHTELQNHQKTSSSGALLLDTQPSSHCCNRIPFAPAWLL
jgi:hypothetical protein